MDAKWTMWSDISVKIAYLFYVDSIQHSTMRYVYEAFIALLWVICWVVNNCLIPQNLTPVIFAHAPAGASTKTLVHYAQEIHEKGDFKYFDYGRSENEALYGQPTPPLYNVTNISAPVALIYATNDWLAGPQVCKTCCIICYTYIFNWFAVVIRIFHQPFHFNFFPLPLSRIKWSVTVTCLLFFFQDVELLYRKLPNPIGMFKVPFEDFNHLDFMWGLDVKRLVYINLMEMMEKYRSTWKKRIKENLSYLITKLCVIPFIIKYPSP